MISGIFRPKVNGAVIAVETMMDCLKAEHHKVDLLTRRSYGTPRKQLFNGSVVYRTGPSGISYPERILLAANQVLLGIRIFRRGNYDIIHCHGFTALAAGLFLGRLFGRPVVATFHGFTSLHGQAARRTRAPELVFALTRPVERFLVSMASYVTAESSEFGDLITQLYGVPRRRISVVPHAVDTKFFKFEPSKATVPTILFVGGLTKVHGPELLIRSAGLLKELLPDFRLLLVGGGPSETLCKSIVQELRLEDRVLFMGIVRDRKKLQKVYADSWVLVIPQDYPGYFLSLAALEALSTGRPVVATQALDRRLTKSGVYTVSRNQDDLAEIMAKIVEMKDDEYNQVSLAARKYIEVNCSFPIISRELVGIYRSAFEIGEKPG